MWRSGFGSVGTLYSIAYCRFYSYSEKYLCYRIILIEGVNCVHSLFIYKGIEFRPSPLQAKRGHAVELSGAVSSLGGQPP